MQQLQNAELEALIVQVNIAFPTTDDLRNVLPEPLWSWAANNLPQNYGKAAFVADVLRYANSNGQVEALVWALHSSTAHPDLLAVIEGVIWFAEEQRRRVREATSALLVADTPMVNREFLRQRVRAFVDPGAGPRRVLVIPPSEYPGKSHSENLLRHVADALKLAYVFIDCMQVRTCLDAARIIANTLHIYESAMDTQLRDASLPGATFTAWLRGKLDFGPRTRRAWIVFDHVVKPKPSEAVESIALALAEAAAQGHLRSLYVTLIDSDYSPRVGFGPLANPLYRDNPLTPLTSTDLTAFLTSWAAWYRKPLTPAEAAAEAQAALQKVVLPLTRESTRELVQRLAERIEARNLFD
jgi:hypothetical protein